MAVLLNNVAGTDAVTDNQIETPNAVGLSILVANAAVVVNFKRTPTGQSNESTWTDDILLTPQTAQYHNVSGFRFRNAQTGVIARVVAVLSEPADPQALGATPYTASLSAAGGVSPAQQVTRVSVLPAGPADLQQVLLDLNPTFPGVEWFCVYNSSTGYWDVAGGPDLEAENSANQALTLGWVEYLSIAVPNQGDYYVGTEGAWWAIGNVGQLVQLGVSQGAGVPPWAPGGQAYGGAESALPGTRRRINGFAAAQHASLMAVASVTALGGATINNLSMFVQPIRIK